LGCGKTDANTKLLFVSDGSIIYTIDDNGSGLNQLFSFPDKITCPSWSPSGGHLAFVLSGDSNDNINDDIYILNVKNRNLSQLNLENLDMFDVSWGDKGFVFAAAPYRKGFADIYLVDSKGTYIEEITYDAATDYAPDWSPDGKKITFSTNRLYPSSQGSGYYDFNIFVMNSDGSNLIAITNDKSTNYSPKWSPDGGQIVFSSNRNGNFDLFLINVDGTSLSQLTSSIGDDILPSWSPDGKQIAFASNSNNTQNAYDIYLLNLSDLTVKRLTNSGKNTCPIWQP
jgi:TolB protein